MCIEETQFTVNRSPLAYITSGKKTSSSATVKERAGETGHKGTPNGLHGGARMTAST